MAVVYVDVSAKLENWTADSVIALTNGEEHVLVLSANVKQAARAWLRQRFPNRRGSYHAYVLLAILVTLLVGSVVERLDYLIIDADYPGEGAAGKIKNELTPLMRRRAAQFSGKNILFQQVKGTRADRLAREVYQQKDRRRWRHVTLAELQQVFNQ